MAQLQHLRKSVTEMDSETLVDVIKRIRRSRRVPAQRGKKESKVKRKDKLNSLVSTMSKDDIRDLINKLK